MKLSDKTLCTGCGACLNICSTKSIKMIEHSNGFLFPTIDNNNCIKCGMCEQTCPVISSVNLSDIKKVFAFSDQNNPNLKHSSSGGGAYAISKAILEKGGIVFGAEYDMNMTVHHVAIFSVSELERIQGSKYVQSEQGNCYKQVKSMLTEGKDVLYIGTPCQIAGLKKFLLKDYSNLYTCDLFCGGVPSPKVFKKYIGYLENKKKDKIHSLNFRSKRYGYGYLLSSYTHCKKNSESILSSKDTRYVKCIGAGYVRESCFNCKFASLRRIGDVSCGDFWNIKIDYNIWNKGVSLLTVNTQKGFHLIEPLRKSFLEEHTIEEAVNSQGCSIKPNKSKPNDYMHFFRDIDNLSWMQFSNKYLGPKSLKEKIIEIMPTFLISFVRTKRMKSRNVK